MLKSLRASAWDSLCEVHGAAESCTLSAAVAAWGKTGHVCVLCRPSVMTHPRARRGHGARTRRRVGRGGANRVAPCFAEQPGVGPVSLALSLSLSLRSAGTVCTFLPVFTFAFCESEELCSVRSREQPVLSFFCGFFCVAFFFFFL